MEVKSFKASEELLSILSGVESADPGVASGTLDLPRGFASPLRQFCGRRVPAQGSRQIADLAIRRSDGSRFARCSP